MSDATIAKSIVMATDEVSVAAGLTSPHGF